MIRNKKNITSLAYKFSTRWGGCLLCFVLLAGCADENEIPMLTIDTISFYADLGANQNSATPIDLVLVYNTEVNKMISSLSASKYFENALQLQRDNPTSLDVWHWELVPGQSVTDFEIDQSLGDAFDGYVFANYLSPGDHRVKVPPSGKVKILLLKNDMKDLATLNVQHVVQGVSSPTPLNAPTAPSQATQQQKSQQIGRSTAEFKAFDLRPKGSEPYLTPPYLFQVEGTPNVGDTGLLDLRPEDSKKGMGDTNLVFPNDHVPNAISAAPAAPCPQRALQKSSDSESAYALQPSTPEGTIYDHMPYHGPMTTTHTHIHPHQISRPLHDGGTQVQQIIHSHEHGHPHPLIGGDPQSIATIQLAPQHVVNH